MDKTDFEKRLLSDVIVNGGKSWDKRQTVFEIMPRDFLKHAEESLLTKEAGRFINVLTNTKRALDSQIELIIYENGYGDKMKKENWKFPKKISFLKNRGIIAPRLLEKINKARNQLEHQFVTPKVEETEDALDVVTLFVGYVNALPRVPDMIALGFGEGGTKYFDVQFNKIKFEFEVAQDNEKIFSIREDDSGFKRLLGIFYGTQPATYTLMSRTELQDRHY